mmetsp:Transcript_9627/g.16687  ORF Transcript_9627/g.16687 Transcript_9627/m.16687 type:complete len:107 (+) Transcript_9627:762-1082(+)
MTRSSTTPCGVLVGQWYPSSWASLLRSKKRWPEGTASHEVLFSIPVALLCFSYKRIHIGLLGSMVLVTIYNASSRYTFYMVSSYGQALRRELNIPLKRGASALIES